MYESLYNILTNQPDKVPDSVGFITAYRAWNIMPPSFLLDINSRSVWPPRERNTAVCLNHLSNKHVAPVITCLCGFWAFKEFGDLCRSNGSTGIALGCPPIIGKVALWGRVIETDLGYRAQYAYPLSLIVVSRSVVAGMETLHTRYGVDVSMDLSFYGRIKEDYDKKIWNQKLETQQQQAREELNRLEEARGIKIAKKELRKKFKQMFNKNFKPVEYTPTDDSVEGGNDG